MIIKTREISETAFENIIYSIAHFRSKTNKRFRFEFSNRIAGEFETTSSFKRNNYDLTL